MARDQHTAVSNQPREQVVLAAEQAPVVDPSTGAEGRTIQTIQPGADGLEQAEGCQRPEHGQPAAEAWTAPTARLRDIGEVPFGPLPPVAETVHGVDDRVRITHTAACPWRAHSSLLVTAADNSRWIGTGCFIGPHTLVTAGHVVRIKNSGALGRDGWVKSIQDMPGRGGDENDENDENYDYGAIIIPTELGSTTGWFGSGAWPDAGLLQTAGGQSGSAVYRVVNGGRYGFAVHAYGGVTVNSGTGNAQPVYDNLVAWRAWCPAARHRHDLRQQRPHTTSTPRHQHTRANLRPRGPTSTPQKRTVMAVTYNEAPVSETEEPAPLYCAQPPVTEPDLRPGLSPDRLSAILLMRTKWVSGTVLHYCFLNESDGASDGQLDEQRDEVRQAFRDWEAIGIGLKFREVDRPAEAEIRIGFRRGDGSWSYVGRDALGISTRERTMNFGWDLTSRHGKATARHEIGHALGFAHEHQNPFAGIEWDEEKVYATLAAPPNKWPRERTFHNILRKLSISEVEGSDWDPASIMQYPFPPGLIIRPEKYHRDGIPDPLALSERDKEYVKRWYPPLDDMPTELHPFQSVELTLAAGEQSDFAIVPSETRMYEIGTLGNSDVVMVLFEKIDGELRFFTAEDDSGTDSNAHLKVRLFEGRRYVLRTRLYSAWGSGKAALMLW
ncbi:M12 family metallopeptidase [Streptomyces sp. NPDC006134]|uniref:M12 family metallopeptidase n=1 Tax=Streptomyces sp. NPDC006134 TaxID=3154467 RepID=UPI0033FED401